MFSFFLSQCFLKDKENVYFLFLSSYRNTCESLGILEKAVETLACISCSHNISCSPKLPLVFLQHNRNMVHVFDFSNIVCLQDHCSLMQIKIQQIFSICVFTFHLVSENMCLLVCFSWFPCFFFQGCNILVYNVLVLEIGILYHTFSHGLTCFI